MACPKCKHENPPEAQFCLRCHTPLRYVCPSCKHVQTQGGTCEKCGVDFKKFLAMMQFQLEMKEREERDRQKKRHRLLKQIFLLPVTGGFSLIAYFKSRLSGD